LQNVCLELATVGDLKLCERPQNYTMAPHANLNIRANIKVSWHMLCGLSAMHMCMCIGADWRLHVLGCLAQKIHLGDVMET
jgi:hypothetical protein